MPPPDSASRAVRFERLKQSAVTLIAVVCGIAALLSAPRVLPLLRNQQTQSTSQDSLADAVNLVPGTMDRLRLSAETARSLGIRTQPVQPPPPATTLRLLGSLFIDPNRLVHVHTRFPGEVVEIGRASAATPSDSVRTGVPDRPLRVGDHVAKDQLLAVVWSKEVGEQKANLIDALSQRYLDDSTLRRLKSLDKGVVAEKAIYEAERNLEADMIAVTSVERTLRSWHIPEDDIVDVRAEAERIHQGNLQRDLKFERSWAQVEIKAPIAGVILEKNVALGDVVDNTLDLFKVADLSRIGVLANVYEEDLPKLAALAPEDRRWQIHLKAEPDSPPIPGTFDVIGNVIDPNQHTAIVTGWLDNPAGRLRVGQFITATVELPTPEDLVAVPDSAVFEDGSNSYVFVAADASGLDVTRREVALVRRVHDLVLLRTHPKPSEQAAGMQPIRQGELVVTNSVIELAGALSNLKTKQ